MTKNATLRRYSYFKHAEARRAYARERGKMRYAALSPEGKRLKREKEKKHRRKSVLKRKWGLTPEAYDQLSAQQGHGCAICKRPPKAGRWLSIDHDHETGRIRGLLCDRCNLGIGILGDHADDLRRALAYLEAGRLC